MTALPAAPPSRSARFESNVLVGVGVASLAVLGGLYVLLYGTEDAEKMLLLSLLFGVSNVLIGLYRHVRDWRKGRSPPA